jgi:hypothetical protein
VLEDKPLMRKNDPLAQSRDSGNFAVRPWESHTCIDIVHMRKCMCGVRFRSESHYLELRLTNGSYAAGGNAIDHMLCEAIRRPRFCAHRTRKVDGMGGWKACKKTDWERKTCDGAFAETQIHAPTLGAWSVKTKYHEDNLRAPR